MSPAPEGVDASDGSSRPFGGSGGMGKVGLGTIDLEPELVEAIAQAARRAGLTMAAWCRRAYEEQVRREKPCRGAGSQAD